MSEIFELERLLTLLPIKYKGITYTASMTADFIRAFAYYEDILDYEINVMPATDRGENTIKIMLECMNEVASLILDDID